VRALTVLAETWPLHTPFAISRGTRSEARVVSVAIADGDHAGRGECLPYPRYGETVEGVTETVERLAGEIAAGMDREALANVLPPGAARNAVDCALWDLEAKQSGRPAWAIAGLEAPAPVLSAFTIGLDTAEAMAARAAAEPHCGGEPRASRGLRALTGPRWVRGSPTRGSREYATRFPGIVRFFTS
jgi:L-alanine-DL-glutamate epimerase-like enolase superfamily enzyme